MSTASESTAVTTSVGVSPRHSVAGPIILWLLVQLMTLIVGTLGLRFSAQYANPGDIESLRLMLIVQIVVATASYRYLLASPFATLTAALSVWPFSVLSAFLSGERLAETILAGIYVSVWLMALGMLNRVKGTPLPPTVAALLNLLTLGVPALVYLSMEFGRREIPRIGPIFDVLRLLEPAAPATVGLLPSFVILLAVALRLLRK